LYRAKRWSNSDGTTAGTALLKDLVNYFSGSKVDLTPGFYAEAGGAQNNKFRTEIRGCN
jgi:hypothetical protein